MQTVGSYWPFATTLFDYVRRAMPFNAPQSLSPDQVYAVTAFVLHLNGLLPEDAVLDAASLQSRAHAKPRRLSRSRSAGCRAPTLNMASPAATCRGRLSRDIRPFIHPAELRSALLSSLPWPRLVRRWAGLPVGSGFGVMDEVGVQLLSCGSKPNGRKP